MKPKRTQRTPHSFIKNGKERCVLLRSFFCEIYNFCMTYETKKNAKNAAFIYKERKRTQRTPRSFIKKGKERKNVAFFWKERMPNPAVSSAVSVLFPPVSSTKSVLICAVSSCSNRITNSFRTLPLLLRNKSQTCARSQVLRKKIQRAMYTTD